MKVRVRFAPSPTGNLHIGGARTALYNYLYAKANDGQYILRIEDTDQERSSQEFEQAQIKDLKWLGLAHDEGPEVGGEFGPYHQSERLEIYKKYAQDLFEAGKAFYDFCTEEELAEMARKNKEEGAPPYTGQWKEKEFWPKALERIKAGEKAPLRFLVPEKEISFSDHVRGEIRFPKGMVGDFVIMRSNGVPTYNFCNVIDDHLGEITHVIRGEDHVNNTLRQVFIYEAIGARLPQFAHVSLLIGADRQKLSKRHGATSVKQYREEGYLASALGNYLCLLGWSHPEEKDVFDLDEIGNKDIFNLERFSKSHAIYDIEKLKYINAQHLKKLELDELLELVEPFLAKDSFYFKQSLQWQKDFLGLYQEKVQLLSEFEGQMENILSADFELTEEVRDVLSWESTPKMKEYLSSQLELVSEEFVSTDLFSSWMEYCKKELKITGKALFMGMRVVLTGQNHGPDLKVLIPLTPVSILKKRLSQ